MYTSPKVDTAWIYNMIQTKAYYNGNSFLSLPKFLNANIAIYYEFVTFLKLLGSIFIMTIIVYHIQ